jgi:hypothetical protein
MESSVFSSISPDIYYEGAPPVTSNYLFINSFKLINSVQVDFRITNQPKNIVPGNCDC